MLTADRISKQYPTPRGPLPVLDDVSLTVEHGESVAVMGPSGCGKSTLLYLLGALEPPSSGTIAIDGTNPYALGEREQAAFRGAHIGFVFQDHLLLPQLSALDNVLVPTLGTVRLRRTLAALAASPRQAGHDGSNGTPIQRARELLTEVGLADRLEHRPAELSGGERQRVAIARALIRRPSLLLCDEPTGNLDRSSAASVADLLLRVHQAHKTMLVVVTHSPALAERCARRYELNDRRLQAAS